jgi:hypothetical protein
MSPSVRHVALLALLLLVAVPAGAQARNHKVDGRIAGAPLAKGGAVTVPLKLTARNGRALKLGTRKVRVRFKRARLPVTGAPGASRLAPRALQPGDRLRGVTSLTKKTRRKLRWRARPTLKLRRVRVARRIRRDRLAPMPTRPPVVMPMTRTPEQIIRDIGTRATTLNIRIGELGSITQQIGRLQALALPVGLGGITLAFETLTTALEGRAGTDPAFEALLDAVEAIAPGTDWLGTAMDAIDTSVRTTRVVAGIGDAVETLSVEAPLLATQFGMLQQFPGMVAQLTAIEDALARVESRLGAVEAASGSVNSQTGELNSGMLSVADDASALAADAEADADLASVSAGVDALGTDMAGLTSGFGALQSSLNQLDPALDALGADAVALETMVEGLEAFGLGGG